MISVFDSTLTPACLKVLLVEDCAEDAELIQELLLESRQRKSITLTNVVRLSAAIEILTNQTFDVILLDLSLSDSQQFNTLFRLQDYGINIPIVILTASEDEELAVELIAAGAQDYLVKRQVDSRLLIRTIRCAIVRQKRQAEWQESQQKYPVAVLNYTIDAVADPIFVKDEQHHWILVNDAFCNLIGKQRDELLGKSDYDFFPKAEADIFWQNDEQVFRTGEENDSEEIFTDNRGDKHILSTKKTAFNHTDGSKILVGVIRDITEDKRQQLALQKSESRLSQLAANLPGVIYQFRLSTDGQKSFVYISSGCRELYELSAEELQQNFELALSLIHPEDRQKIEDSVAVSAATMQPWQQEWRILLPSGKLKWLQGKSKPERLNFQTELGEEGDIIWEGIILDISDLKQAEAALQGSEQRFRSLIANIPGAIYRCRYDAHWTIEFISDEIEVISGYPAADFIDNRGLSFASIIHPADIEIIDRKVREGVELRQPFYVEYRIVRADGAVRWMSERGRPSYDSAGEVLCLEGAIFDITHHKQAELTISLVTQAVESAGDAIAIADLEGYSIYHNRAFIQRYGYTVEELNDAGGPAVMYAKYQDLRKLFVLLRKGLPWSGKIELKAKNGEPIETQLRADCIKDSDDQPIGMMAVIADFTELKRTELALQLSQERLQLAVSGSSLGLWDWNIATGETYFDLQWKAMLGYAETEIENNFQSWENLLHPEDKPKVMAALNAYLEGTTNIYEVEFRMLNKTGNWQWIMVAGKVVEYDEWGAPLRMAGSHKDISARIAAEVERTQLIASLQQLTDQLQEAQKIAHIGNWEFEIATGIISWSEELFRVYDRELGIPPTPEELVEQIHPDDRERFREVLQRAMNEGIACDIDHRICFPIGEMRYVNTKGQALKNELGQVVRLFGTAMDITDRKLAEIALRESEQRFRAVFEKAAIGIVQVLPDGRFLKVNQGFCNIIGYSKSELNSQNIWDISHPEDVEADMESGNRILTGEILNYSIEKRFICKDGSFVWANVTVSLVRDGFGEPSYTIGVVEDISDRKFAEAILRQQLKRERLVVAMLERIRSSLNLEEILTTTVAEVRQFLQTDRTIIYRFNPDWIGVVAVESVGENWISIQGMTIEDSCFRDSYAATYKYGRIRAMDDIHKAGIAECYINLLAQFQVQANLVVPILQGEKLWGLLIAHHCASVRHWQEIEVECLKQISVQLAIAIVQSTLFEQAQTEIADRKQAELALQESEARERSKALQLEIAINRLKTTQAQLVQNEKMVSLGQLVAGVAHEINNPVSFIHGNLNPARGYALDLLELINIYQRYYPDPPAEVLEKIDNIDLGYVADDLPKLFNSMQVGTDRIVEIVKSLRNFSRLDEAERKLVNIHDGIDSTLMILQNRLKSHSSRRGIQVVKDYHKLPKIECFPGQLNQVFMNILINAIDALEERDKQREPQECDRHPSIITIRTYLVTEGLVAVSIADNGPGIPESVSSRLFDPFFTTKPVGKGTGLGLSISYSIVVDRHGGKLSCISAPGEGAEFLIEIPVHPPNG
jgi:PAS domain S-box-containing protein